MLLRAMYSYAALNALGVLIACKNFQTIYVPIVEEI